MKTSYKGLLMAISLSVFHTFAIAQGTVNPNINETTAQKKYSLEEYRTMDAIGQEHLDDFDILDYDVYSNQLWEHLNESHAQDIVVYYPDGTTTTGIPDHIKKLQPTFEYAPDTTIVAHPIRIVSPDGEWTSVVGEVTGTFTRPMKLANGKQIQPTGKKFKYTMSTVGHWKNNVMDKEYLYWDNNSIMKQMGIN